MPGIDAVAFIRAKISESRLSDFHPTFGLTQGSNLDDDFPAVAHGLFGLAEIQAIEAEDFAGTGLRTDGCKASGESPAERRARLRSRMAELKRQGVKNFNIQIAEEEGISKSMVKKLLSSSAEPAEAMEAAQVMPTWLGGVSPKSKNQR
jgi:hypothetical protein